MELLFASSFLKLVRMGVKMSRPLDGLAMSIDVVGGGITGGLLLRRVPELSCPSRQRIGQGFSLIRPGHLREQPLRVEVAVGAVATTEQRERTASVAAQIPGPTEPDDS
jgi:hypothetical protein